MLKLAEIILFTTNLSQISKDAFHQTALLASQLNAKKIVLLHVMEKLAESYEARVKSMFGEKQYATILEKHVNDAHKMMIGKITTQQIVHAALEQLCRESGCKEHNLEQVPMEIVVKPGEIVETILSEADAHHCDLIFMGASKGLVAGTAVGPHIKSVMKNAKVPVLVIPPA